MATFNKGTTRKEIDRICGAAVRFVEAEEKAFAKYGEDAAGRKKGSKNYDPHVLHCITAIDAFVAGVQWEQRRAAVRAKRAAKKGA